MKNKFTVLMFLIVPLCTIIFQLFYINTVKQAVSSIIYIGVNFCFSLLCYKLFNKANINLSNSKVKIAVLIISLSAIDQILKIIIHISQARFNIIGEFFCIKISKNINQAAALNLFGIEINTLFIALMKLLLIILIIIAFKKFKKKSNNLLCAFVLLLAGSISNFIDSAVWGYTLDYIYFYKLVCYDLKDFYVDTSVGYLLIAFLFSKKEQKPTCR